MPYGAPEDRSTEPGLGLLFSHLLIVSSVVGRRGGTPSVIPGFIGASTNVIGMLHSSRGNVDDDQTNFIMSNSVSMTLALHRLTHAMPKAVFVSIPIASQTSITPSLLGCNGRLPPKTTTCS